MYPLKKKVIFPCHVGLLLEVKKWNLHVFPKKQQPELPTQRPDRCTAPDNTGENRRPGISFPVFQGVLGFVADLEGGRDLLKKPGLNLKEA